MTKIIFHLGDRKTGSTAIQTTLSSNSWKCDSVKLLYPAPKGGTHIGLAKCLDKIKRETSLSNHPDAARIFGELMARIEGTTADVVVISAEHFEEVGPFVLKAAVRAFLPQYADEARYIAYVRPHADRIASSYAERIKQGMIFGTMEELAQQFATSHKFIYAPRFAKWRKAFGDAFELRVMNRDLLYRNDVVADFLQFALQTDDFSLLDTPDANESLSLENLAIVRQLQMRLRPGQEKFHDYQTIFGRDLSRRMNATAYREGTKLRMHRALAEAVRDLYAADASALDAAFFSGTPMQDALEVAISKAVDKEQPVGIEDHFSDREQYLINLFVDQTAALIGTNPKLLAGQMRQDHRNTIVSDEIIAGAAKPMRDRAGKGLKAGRRAKAGGGGEGKAAGKAGGRRAGAGRGKVAEPAAGGAE